MRSSPFGMFDVFELKRRATVETGQPWSPADLAGGGRTVIWYDLGGLSGPVDQLTDQIGSNHMVQENTDRRATAAGGVLTFDGVDDFYANALDFRSAFTLVMAVNKSANLRHPFTITEGTSEALRVMSGPWRWVGDEITTTDNTGLHVLAVAFDGSTVTGYFNGVAESSAARSVTTDTPALAIGSRDAAAPSSPFHGELHGQIIIANDALTPAEIASATQFVANSAGVAL